MVLACGESRPRTTALLTSESDAPMTIREDCVLTEEKCTHCHTIGRVLVAEARTAAEWEPIVHKMRLQASSGITRLDAEAVVRCLVYRSQGR